MNFRFLFKCSVDFMQPSVLKITWRSTFKDPESREISDRQNLWCKYWGYWSNWNKLQTSKRYWKMECFFENHWYKSNPWIFRSHKKPSDSFCFKNFENSKLSYETCWSRFELIKQEFRKFSNICSERSEICKYWRSMLKLISLLKGCVEAVSEGNWEVHFHTMQRLLSVFCILDSIHYLRNTSWYLEKMRKFPNEYPQKYKHSQERKFLVKTNAGYFK